MAERDLLALSSTLRDSAGIAVGDSSMLLMMADDYELEVGSVGDSSSGSYTLTLATAVELPAGEEVWAQLDPGNRDLWSYSGRQGQHVRIDMRSSDFDTYLELRGPSGEILAENDDYGGLNSRIEDFVLPADGSYALVSRSYRVEGGGSYALSLRIIVPRTADEIPTETLAADIPFTATISPGAAYAWTLSGLRSDLITVSASSLDGTTAPTLTLLAPDRAVLQESTTGANNTTSVLSNVVLPEAGGYTILAYGRDEGETRMRLIVEFGKPMHLPFDGTSPVSVQAVLTDPGVWTFDGRPGQIVSLALHNVGTGTLTILDPSRQQLSETLGAAEGPTLAIDGVMLGQSGVYVVVTHVTDALPFSLTITSVTGQPIAVDESISRAIERANATQFWEFQGEEGQYVDISMRSTELNPYLKVYGPDGAVVDEAYGEGGLQPVDAQITLLRLPIDGSYTMAARAQGGGTGAYTLTLSTPILHPIAIGDTVTGTTVSKQYYSFIGSIGQLVRIDMSTIDEGDMDPAVELIGPDGETLTRDNDGGSGNNTMLLAALPFDGIYIIRPNANTELLGAFRLSLTEAPMELLELDSGTEQPVIAGKALVFEGRAGEVLRIMENAETAQSSFDLALELVDPEGAILADYDSNISSDDSMLLRVMIPRDGRFMILPRADLDAVPVSIRSFISEELTPVERDKAAADSLLAMIGHQAFTSTLSLLNHIESTGQISLTLSELYEICKMGTSTGDATYVRVACELLISRAPVVKPGLLERGAIDSAFSDPWKLEVAAASRVTITLSAAGDGSLDPYLALYDAGFQIIAWNDDSEGGRDSAVNDISLAGPGLYWIAASRCCPSNDQGSVGAYVLEVTVKEEE